MQAGAGSSNAKSSVGGGQNSMVGSVPAYMHMNTGGVGGGPVFANFPPTPPSATVIPKSSSVNAIAHLHGTSLKTSEIGNVWFGKFFV